MLVSLVLATLGISVAVSDEAPDRPLPCPLALPYGGLRGAMGWSVYSELVVGVANIQEALHCVLGSIERRPTLDWGEDGHVREEADLILRLSKEYERRLYLDRAREKMKADELACVAREADQAMALAVLRRRELEWSQAEVKPEVLALAWWCYEASRVMAEAAGAWARDPMRREVFTEEVQRVLREVVKVAFRVCGGGLLGELESILVKISQDLENELELSDLNLWRTGALERILREIDLVLIGKTQRTSVDMRKIMEDLFNDFKVEVYLPDGGYSRIWLSLLPEPGHLHFWLGGNSRDEVKASWAKMKA